MSGDVGVRSTYGLAARSGQTVEVGLPDEAPDTAPAPMSDLPIIQPTLRFDGARILLAEDNLLNQQIAKEMLEDAGAVVTLANDGKEAIDRRLRRPSTASHGRAHAGDRRVVTEALRMLKTTADLPIIAMTANAMVEDREDCLRSDERLFPSP